MSTLRNIIFVPAWVAEGLQRQQKTLASVLDLRTLRTFTSVNDLVGLVALNNAASELLGSSVQLTIGENLTQLWQRSADEETRGFLANTIYPNLTPEAGSAVIERLKGGLQYQTDTDNSFDAFDLGYDASAIVLKAGFFDAMNRVDMEYQLIEAILEILYAYHPHHIVANTVIGRRYLELLQTRVG